MRPRHRTPSIFSLSMLDVIVCALGCVTLLWLLGIREADRRAREVTEKSQQLDQTLAELMQSQGERNAAVTNLDEARERLKALEARVRASLELLARKRQEVDELTRDLAKNQDELSASEKLLREERGRAASAAKLLKDEQGRSAELAKQVETKDDTIASVRADIKAAKGAAADYEARVQKLQEQISRQQKDLADARSSMVDLQGQKRVVADELDRVRAAADNRFAGVTLTGRRVLFMVDISGSMDLIDERTTAPGKWAGVCETIVKVMRSLPDLEKFQVVTFSQTPSHPLGSANQWLDYDPKLSAEGVRKALLAIKPQGNTDMTSAFETAFAYKNSGLDTIYLFSDGLPNIGEGLTLTESVTLAEPQKAAKLARYVRSALQTRWNPRQPGRSQVRINAIGFFYESPDVGAFLWALTRENDGSFVGMSRP